MAAHPSELNNLLNSSVRCGPLIVVLAERAQEVVDRAGKSWRGGTLLILLGLFAYRPTPLRSPNHFEVHAHYGAL